MDSRKISTDCAFAIGTTHRVCEDYALCNENAAVLSDGCSSAPNSDFGARILASHAMLASDRRSSYEPWWTIFSRAVNQSEKTCITLGLSRRCLDATLLCARVDQEGNKVDVGVCGDGIVLGRYRNGDFLLYHSAYEDQGDGEWPFYPNLLCDNERRLRYQDAGHGENTIKTFRKDANGYSQEEEIHSSIKFLLNIRVINSSVTIPPFCGAFDFYEFDLILLLSDGFTHFYEIVETETSRSRQDVSWQDVLSLLLGFKNFNGAFVQRRMDRFLKDCKKRNWHNADDISVAAIHVGS